MWLHQKWKTKSGELSVPSTGRPAIYWPQPSPPFFCSHPTMERDRETRGPRYSRIPGPGLADPEIRAHESSLSPNGWRPEWRTSGMADPRNGGPPEWRAVPVSRTRCVPSDIVSDSSDCLLMNIYRPSDVAVLMNTCTHERVLVCNTNFILLLKLWNCSCNCNKLN